MRIGLLETGEPPVALQPEFGRYGGMFQTLLGPGHAYATYDVQAGQLPQSPGEQDAWIITGSSAGVYDPLPWIEPLSDLLRAACGRVPLVGVCFGHQIMAQAFGGQVVKSDKGWGVGLHQYDIATTAPWMDDNRSIAIPASHQDQVVALPAGARVLAGSDFTPFGVLAYDAPAGQAAAISMQVHPEFDPAYAAALIEARRGSRYTDPQADAAIASLQAPNDRHRVAGWIGRFLEQA
ncbi:MULTISPECIES: glutamine amidotransferase-related protein [unclassified Caulobacter]|uniref:glutamine amidotransferase-related protein n=1 Tax=unclassified Caulobacter TaxID=2648921 RepID=UPI000D338622|nr:MULTISPECIES: GMP synthase [unclassified Caulobacter]PTS88549.1 GMP synthase [Caulobacter sp. HMWF009]PTT09680.1 GMP synthase [Caulobacter sp. HMWF025]PTT81840.1 GMP synthase [Pseudomonas sp. HMWF010]